MVDAIFWLVGELIHLMILAVIVAVVLNMLVQFGVVDGRHRFVYSVQDFLNRVTEPVLSPIRRHLPLFGNIDLSPLIAILLLQALEIVLADVHTHLLLAGMDY